MADSSNMCLLEPETDIKSLKEALCAQQLLLQKLYTELDEEREASATAASEALSMILRLQEEKARMKMEASQYKRMAEEKMYHAEGSLEFFEDLLYQKEMEIASLEFQIQAYRCKLLSKGCSDLGVSENRIPENLLLQRNDAFFGEMGANGNLRRLSSLPAIQLKDFYLNKGSIETERSATPVSDLSPKILEENTHQVVDIQSLDLENKLGNSYWEQIRKLDKRVKELSDCKDTSAKLKGELGSCSLFSQVSTSTSWDPTRGKVSINDQVKISENSREIEAVVNSPYSSSVHDIFEVPQTMENGRTFANEEKGQSKLILEREDRLGTPDLVLEENFESPVKNETERMKTVLLTANHEKKLSKLKDGMEVDCKVALLREKIGVAECQAAFQQLNRRIGQLEGERNCTRHEISDGGEEGLNLLKEIREQLNSIQSEMRSLRTKKSPRPDESVIHSVTEAMLYFWL